MSDWFTVEQIDNSTYAVSEYKHWEETHCYLLLGAERAVLIDVYMPSIRMAKVNRSVSRTVTLPAWLNAAALERNINFSQVLQEALKMQLHMG